jgi:electron-transferring-flavoprotein dehydrogenase
MFAAPRANADNRSITQADRRSQPMSERDTMEYDVVTVGAGPAGLAFAIRLKQLKPELSVCVIEKASTVGAQILSGAVIEPEPLNELLPDQQESAADLRTGNEGRVLVPARRRTRDPVAATPPQMHNHGNFIVSLGALCAWLAPQAEALGVEIYPGFAAAELLFDDGGAVCGVRIGDMGVAKDGTHKAGYTQGIDIRAKTTVLAEGCRGSISKQLIAKYQLDANSDAQTYGIGIKELWQLPPGRAEAGKVMHTLGWPLNTSTYGGSFIYHLDKDRVAIGFVAGLDYADPLFRPWEAFQQLKNHALVKPLLEGGSIVSAGARALIEGGFQSLPKVEMPGALLIGDSAGLMNVPKIKGTHQALRSGMLAAEHLAATGVSTGWNANCASRPSSPNSKRCATSAPASTRGCGSASPTRAGKPSRKACRRGR